MPRRYWIVLAVILAAAFGLRVYELGNYPAGLFCDEAAEGYNAYTLLHSGQDEHGKTLPLFIWSFFAFKYPLYTYPTVPWVALFGLTEFATRFQAALYGTGTVAVAFLIGRQLFHPVAGLAAAAVLAVMPWHFHFSRIAFALIGFPFWFGLGFYFFVRAVGETARRRDWLLAATCFALCFYIYAISQLMVPVFLAVAVLLCMHAVWRRRWWVLQAVVVGLAVSLPFVVFYWNHVDRASIYVMQTSVLAWPAPLAEKLDIIFKQNWPTYFQRAFLLESGDPILRHGVRNHGVLYPALVPWIALGALGALVHRSIASKLLLVWVALYPLGAAVTRETPTATRSILGTLAFALLAGVGIERAIALIRLIPIRVVRIIGVSAIVLAAAVPLGQQTVRYLDLYFNDYPTYAATGIEGFQYGYKEVFELMEEKRRPGDQVLYSVTAVNNPYIFNLFYVRRPPLRVSEWGSADTDYLGVRPTEEAWYDPKRRTLFAVLPTDIWFFESWDERIDINGPGETPAFILLDNPKPKKFIESWQLLGPFANEENRNRGAALVDPKSLEALQPLAAGEARWEPYRARGGVVELNRYLSRLFPGSQGNPEYLISYLQAVVRSPDARTRTLELVGSRDELLVWLNGNLVTPKAVGLKEWELEKVELPLAAGDNVLLLKTIETVGDWWFSARIAHADGRADEQLAIVEPAG
jgi:4-amino-4-deoxy-L-arabinose transferase-like glycosyltransferase